MTKRKLLRAVSLCLLVAMVLALPAYAAEVGTIPPAAEDSAQQPTTEATESTDATESATEATESTEPTESTETTEPEDDSDQPSDGDTDADESDEPFSCYTFDAKGNQLDGYWSEKDGVWYLFVTSTQPLSDTELYYTGSVSEASVGELNAETKTVSGAFADSGDKTELTMEDETVITVIAIQSDLPSVYIDLEGTTLDEIHADKDEKHKGNSIYIMDPDGEYDLTVEGTLEIKGRGNSTWKEYEKKAYQIKFDDKTSVMGLGKAKKWVLLANASDDSMIRTKLVYNMASKLGMAFVPQLEYVDLWIEGEYRGTFLLGDKVEPGSSRLDLSDDAGALFEHDEAFYLEEDYWFYSDVLGRHFVMKEIVEEEDAIIEAAMADFEAAVDELTRYLYSTPSYKVTLEDLSAMMDVDSFIKYFLVNEYALNRESFATSFYWYKDGPEDVIHLGPIWDFDTCMGNEGVAYTESYGQEHILFRYLLAIPVFYERTQELLEEYRAELESMTDDVDVLKAQIDASAEMNYLRWDVLGKANPKGGADFHPTFDEAVGAVKNWLTGRETAFQVAECAAVTSVISDDCYDMDICFRDGNDYSKVSFAVWSLADGQDDVAWYTASQDEDGAWHHIVDLGKHNSAGIYRIDAYADDMKDAVATGRNYVDTARGPRYQIKTVVSEDCEVLTITMNDSDLCTDMMFAVWSAEGNQDDLRWYSATRNSDGQWVCEVDLKKHQTAGLYHIHAYTGTGANRHQVDTATADVAFAVVGPELVIEIDEECTTMMLTLENVDGYDRVWVPAWSDEDGQDDLRWYELSKTGQGTWTGIVDLCQHGSAGTYKLHVYGGTTDPDELLVDTTAYVSKKPVKRIEAIVSEDCCTMEIVLRDIGEWENIWIPVWSEENAQDDIQWYTPVKMADGTYSCTVDLEEHKSAGAYQIHVYGGTQNPETLIGDTTADVAAVPGTLTSVKVIVENDEMIITLKNIGEWENIWIPVWSEKNAQDDIQWYTPVKMADGTYSCTVDLTVHKSAGKYQIHVYGGTLSPDTLIGDTTATVAVVPGTTLSVKTAVEGSQMTIVVRNAGEWKDLWIPVWSEENAQDDIQWYRPVAQPDGTWKVDVDLTNHGSIGTYVIHVYGGDTVPMELLIDTSALIESIEKKPMIKAAVSAEDHTMTLTVQNVESYEKIWLPVWSADNGSDDIQWYEPQKLADSNWQYMVDLTAHAGTGTYHVHAYTGIEGPQELITYLDVTVH